MRVTVPSMPLAGALAATAGLAFAPAAGADVLVADTAAGAKAVGPVVVTPDGTRRPLARVSVDPDAPAPAVSPDRRFVVTAVAGGEVPVLLPTDGSPAQKLSLVPGVASGGAAFWWTGATRFASYVGALGNRGSIDTCSLPAASCRNTTAPGADLIGTFESGASLFADQQDYLLPEGLNGAISTWKTATRAQVARVRTTLRRKLRQRVVLRAPDGRTRVLRTTRRSSVSGTDTYTGLADGGPQVLYVRYRTRTTLGTRRRNGRTQVRLRFSETSRSIRVVSDVGRDRSIGFDAPDGATGPLLDRVVVVPGGWLTGLVADDRRGTGFIARLGLGGTVRPLQLGGAPLTARTLAAAIGLPVPAETASAAGERAMDLRPVGYEAVSDSDVVAYDEPSGRRQVVARVPRSGAAPSLVQRGEPGVSYTAVAW